MSTEQPTGSISKKVGVRDGSNLAKFHAFIIKVNNSAYFLTITAVLNESIIIEIVLLENFNRHVQAPKLPPLFPQTKDFYIKIGTQVDTTLENTS